MKKLGSKTKVKFIEMVNVLEDTFRLLNLAYN